MTDMVLLDAGPLGKIAHPNATPDVRDWLQNLLVQGVHIIIPEIADYEVRRELLRAGKTASVARLDELKSTLEYLPLTTEMMLRAAAFWAQARQQGQATADPKALDGDVILAAQATIAGSAAASYVVATTNLDHLAQFTNAQLWDQIR